MAQWCPFRLSDGVGILCCGPRCCRGAGAMRWRCRTKISFIARWAPSFGVNSRCSDTFGEEVLPLSSGGELAPGEPSHGSVPSHERSVVSCADELRRSRGPSGEKAAGESLPSGLPVVNVRWVGRTAFRTAAASGLKFALFGLVRRRIQPHGKILQEERLTSVAAIVTIAEHDRAVREEAYRHAVTHLRLEGLEMDDQAKRIFQSHVDGQISSEEFRVAIDDLNERKFRPVSLSGNRRP
jgi:hypothetical protein